MLIPLIEYFIEGVFAIFKNESLCILFTSLISFLLLSFLKGVYFLLPVEIAVARITFDFFFFLFFVAMSPSIIHVHGRKFKQFRIKGRGSKHLSNRPQ